MTEVASRVLGLLNPYEIQFLQLIGRFKRVWGYEVETRKATRERPFRMRNPNIWEVMLSDRDMFVVDLASWMESFAGKGGLLDKITDKDLSEFGIEERPRDGDDPYWERLHWEARVKSFEGLFPTRAKEKKRWPEKADLRHLKNGLLKLAEGLEAQRNARAHIYDGRDYDIVANLHFTEIAPIFHRMHDVLHDMRLLVDRSGHHFPEVKEPEEDRTARDLVDILLLGSIDKAVMEWKATPGADERRYLWQHRAAYYEHIHNLHDEAGAPAKPMFNERWLR